mgnify:CR=1 FL=1
MYKSEEHSDQDYSIIASSNSDNNEDDDIALVNRFEELNKPIEDGRSDSDKHLKLQEDIFLWNEMLSQSTINIDHLYDKETQRLSIENILKLKHVYQWNFNEKNFKKKITSEISSLRTGYNKMAENQNREKAFKYIVDMIIGYGLLNGVFSLNLYELKEQSILNFILESVHEITFNYDINNREKILDIIKEQSAELKKNKHQLCILTCVPKTEIIKNMNIKDMKECILDDAYILIRDKWGYGSPDLSYESFRNYIQNALFIKYGKLYGDCLGENFNELVDKTGLNFIMNRGLEFDLFATSYLDKEREQMQKSIDKLERRIEQLDYDVFKYSNKFQSKNSKKLIKSFYIPSKFYCEMDKKLIKNIKSNNGKATNIKQEYLTNESDEVVEYVLSLPESDHLTKI